MKKSKTSYSLSWPRRLALAAVMMVTGSALLLRGSYKNGDSSETGVIWVIFCGSCLAVLVLLILMFLKSKKPSA